MLSLWGYAIYNALPTLDLKQAFSFNNSQPPSKEFVDLTQKLKSPEEIQEKGYSEKDLLRYLLHLKNSHIIKGFTWKRIKPKTATFHTIWNTRPKEDEVYVLFGLCTTGEDREQLIKRIRRVNTLDDNTTTMREKIRVYHNFIVRKREATDHAIAITNTEEGLLISDNARKRKCIIRDMTDLAASLVSFHCLYVLRIEI